MKIKLINAMTLPHPNNPKRSILHKAGETVDVSDEIGQRAIDLKAAKKADEDEEGEPEAEVELPERPSNGATKEAWSAYLQALEVATLAELGPLNVPADAKRDDMIAIGDARVAEWNEG